MFHTGIGDTSSYPTLQSFPSTTRGRILHRQAHYLIARTHMSQGMGYRLVTDESHIGHR